MEPSKLTGWDRREWLAIAGVTAIGLGLRLWPIGRLGLTHFDEGIYSLAATWSLQPKGLGAIDPSLIPYAPPGYAMLGGLAYWILGRSDGAMIAVSQMTGTLTIPVVAWLARRTLGPGAGFAAAIFCAFSGPHIAFSRMALTDASFLLWWLLAIGAGMRFLEKPGFARAVGLGLAVGLAQQFKYNGWLTGGIVALAAAWGVASRPESRTRASILGTFGFGGLGAGVAWLVVWPWFAFVEEHGGYSALLRHQRSYLGGFDHWWPNLLIQADEATALSGGVALIAPALILAILTPWISEAAPRSALVRPLPTRRRLLIAALVAVPAGFFVDSPYYLGLPACAWLFLGPGAGPGARMLGIWWILMAATSPFYHPYARLWLPFHAANWLLLGWWFSDGPTGIDRYDLRSWGRPRLLGLGLSTMFLVLLAGILWLTTHRQRRAEAQPGLLGPSDSLYQASVRIADRLPEGVRGLRVLARPPLRYYLAGRISLDTMAGSNDLIRGGDPSIWALVDSAILRSEAGGGSGGSGRGILDRFADRWEIVEEYPTSLSLPALLDLDPGAARRPNADRFSPLWLLRPRTPKALR